MAKRTFAARTFLSFSFRSGTWAGAGAAPSPESNVLSDLFCHPFTTEAAYLTFITAMNAYIADPSDLTDEEHDYLMQLRGTTVALGGALSNLDRDLWIQLLTRTNLSEHERYPFGEQIPTDIAGSDPLGLRLNLPANHHVVIIDPQNTNAVRVTRGSNEVRTQDLLTILGDLWDSATDQDYNFPLWYDLDSLDETDWDSIAVSGAATVRRFTRHTPTQTVTVYVRGGTQTLTKEIHVRRNNGNWQRPIIRIMAYPGDPQRPTIHCGSSLIEAGKPVLDPPAAAAVGAYRFINFIRIDRASVWMSGLEFVGHRGDPPNRIFADKLFLIVNETFGPVAQKNIYDCVFRDCRGIPDDHPEVASYPEWVDSQYYNREHSGTGADVEVWSGNGAEDDPAINAVRVLADDVKIERCHVRPRSVDGPAFTDPAEPQGDLGDGIGSSTLISRLTVTRCLLDGRVAHAQINAVGIDPTVTYCDVSNPDHTCVIFGRGVVTMKYNRIHDWTTRLGETDDPGHGVQIGKNDDGPITSGTVLGNVFYNPGPLQPTGAIWLNASSSAVHDITGVTISQNIVLSGLRLGYSGNDHGTSTNVNNITIQDNAIVGVPVGNDAVNAWDAPILANLYQFPTVMNGIVFVDNLVTRDPDADPTMVAYSQSTGGQTDHTLADLNGFTGSSGNYNSDPLFTDADEGDFRLEGGSPLSPFLIDPEIPYVATPAWDAYDLLDILCGIDQVLCGEVFITGQYSGRVTITAQYTGKSHVVTCECN